MRGALIGFVVMLGLAAGGSTAARVLLLSDTAPSKTSPAAPPAAPVETPGPFTDVRGVSLSAASPPGAIADFPAREVRAGEPIAFPPDTIMFIESGCFACDGPPSTLWRVTRAGEGAVAVDKAFELDRSRYPRGFVMRYDFSGNSIITTVCDNGDCSWLGRGDPDARISIFRSADLGHNWSQTAAFVAGGAFPLGITDEGTVMGDWEDDHATFGYLESGRPLMPQAGGRLFAFVNGGRLFWQAQDGRIFDATGTPIAAPEPAAQVNGLLFEGSELRFMSWSEDTNLPGVAPDWYITTYLEGGEQTFELPSYPYAGGVLDGRFLVLSLERRGADFRPAPVLLDTVRATLHPIPELGDPRFGRNFVRAVYRAPFLRTTVADGFCTPVHIIARHQSEMVACLDNGAVVTSLGGMRRFRGEDWQTVSLPDGRTGWAPASQLTR